MRIEEQQKFPTFGKIYLFLLILTQTVGAAIKVLKPILLTDVLRFGEAISIIIMHSQMALMDISMLVGSVLSDLYCGAYQTCVLQYLIHILLTSPLCTLPLVLDLPLVMRQDLYLGGQGAGALTAFGTARLPTFLSDQFNRNNYKLFSTYQNYIILFSTAIGILTAPHLIYRYGCFGTHECFASAWIAEWFLRLVTFLLYIAMNKAVNAPHPKNSNLLNSVKLAIDAKREKQKARKRTDYKRMPLLEYSRLFDEEFRKNSSLTWSLRTFYFPLAGYWALSSQLTTTWLYQARRLNGVVEGWSTILPSEVCAVVPLLNISFTIILEPMITGMKYPLRTMMLSQIIISFAFFAAAYLEYSILISEPKKIHVFYTLPQNILLSLADTMLILSYKEFVVQDIPANMNTIVQCFFILSRSIGNTIVVLFNVLEHFVSFPPRSIHFFIYAVGLNIMSLFIFAVFNFENELKLQMSRQYSSLDSRNHRPI